MPTTSPAAAVPTGRAIADLVLDKRTREFKRKVELVAMFRTALADAGDDPMLSRKIDMAAELAVVAEAVRAQFLSGTGCADDVVRTSRAASLAERALGIGQRKPSKPSVGDYLASRVAA